MRQLVFISVLLISVSSFSQYSEFGKSENGFIYSSQTMNKLKHIVDSLNLRYRRCEQRGDYFSLKQSKGNYISLKGEKVPAALKDLAENISFEDFICKYPAAIVKQGLLLVQSDYTSYDGKKYTSVFSPNVKGGYSSISFTYPQKVGKPEIKTWLTNDNSYNDNLSLDAVFIREPFVAKALNKKYAEYVLYSDCLVDTNARVFFDQARSGYNGEEKPGGEKLNELMNLIEAQVKTPRQKENEPWDEYLGRLLKADSLKWARLDELAKRDRRFVELIEDAFEEVKAGGESHNEFEEAVRRYLSPEKALYLKRSRKVVGFCSQDDSPRYHAREIASLSAETCNWEVFLRSHLDIMNDRFERNAENSATKAARQTYLPELEGLNIDVASLLYGISLKISNPAANHYFGDIGKIGQALTESGDKLKLEKQILEFIADDTLDDYNRVVFYFLYSHFVYNLEGVDKVEREKKMKSAELLLPVYLANHDTIARQ